MGGGSGARVMPRNKPATGETLWKPMGEGGEAGGKLTRSKVEGNKGVPTNKARIAN